MLSRIIKLRHGVRATYFFLFQKRFLGKLTEIGGHSPEKSAWLADLEHLEEAHPGCVGRHAEEGFSGLSHPAFRTASTVL
jgi:hypothetical protein